MTNAAILKEEHRLDEIARKEMAKIREKEIYMRDDTEFNEWKETMKKKDDVERIEHIHMKKIEMGMARENAIIARETLLMENQELVKETKEKQLIMQEEQEQKKKDELEKKTTLVTEMMKDRENIVINMKAQEEKRKKLHDEVEREMAEAVHKRKEQEEKELERRKQLVKEIREMVAQPINMIKG